MTQRFVIWNLPENLAHRKRSNATYQDLTPEALAKSSPELAAALDGGRVISHSLAVSNLSHLVVTFVVEFDDGRYVG